MAARKPTDGQRGQAGAIWTLVAVQYGEQPSAPVLNSQNGGHDRACFPARREPRNLAGELPAGRAEVRFPVAATLPSAGINFVTAVRFFGSNRILVRLAKS